MGHLIQELEEKGLIRPPSWLATNVHFLGVNGSEAYGCSSGNSDRDIYGFCIPRKDIVFPHLAGVVLGFDTDYERFDQFIAHHIQDGAMEYDVTVFSIVKYFALLRGNNPNILDSLWIPQRCVLHITKIGQLVREKRKVFLSKKLWHTFKSYAFSQLHKAKSKNRIGKRKEEVEKHGTDRKFLYHVLRLMDEVEQLLATGDMDITRDRERLKAVRRGDISEEEVVRIFEAKEKDLEKLYESSVLPYSPDDDKIKALLLQCLEEHYGSLRECVVDQNIAEKTLREVSTLLQERLRLLDRPAAGSVSA